MHVRVWVYEHTPTCYHQKARILTRCMNWPFIWGHGFHVSTKGSDSDRTKYETLNSWERWQSMDKGQLRNGPDEAGGYWEENLFFSLCLWLMAALLFYWCSSLCCFSWYFPRLKPQDLEKRRRSQLQWAGSSVPQLKHSSHRKMPGQGHDSPLPTALRESVTSYRQRKHPAEWFIFKPIGCTLFEKTKVWPSFLAHNWLLR